MVGCGNLLKLSRTGTVAMFSIDRFNIYFSRSEAVIHAYPPGRLRFPTALTRLGPIGHLEASPLASRISLRGQDPAKLRTRVFTTFMPRPEVCSASKPLGKPLP
jgi:hypothetical protein